MQIKKFLLISLIMVIGLSGCNLPDSTELSPEILASQVSKLLTSTPLDSTNEDIPTIVIPTITIQVTEEPIIPSETPTTTQEPTLDPTPSPSQMPIGIPTGTPDWIDTFENGTRFGINPEGYDDGQTKIQVSSGTMTMTSISAIGWRGWRLTSQKPDNYYLEADFMTSECSGSDQYGLVVQSPDFASGYGYYFGLTCDGRYAFQKWDESGLTNLQGWANDPSIAPGSGQNNTIGILKTGNEYNLYINNMSIVTVEHETFSSPGYFGPFIAGVNTPNFTLQIDEISYWSLP